MIRHILLFLLCVYPLISFENPTQLKLYRPYGEVDSSNKPEIIASLKGECFRQSSRIIREDAWRCVADEELHDPCFQRQLGKITEVLCVESPWIKKAIQLKTAQALKNTHHQRLDRAMTLPWALVLSSGVQCVAIDSTEEIEGQPIHYRCSDQSLLFGVVQRCQEEWTILQQARSGQVSTAVIQDAWF